MESGVTQYPVSFPVLKYGHHDTFCRRAWAKGKNWRRSWARLLRNACFAFPRFMGGSWIPKVPGCFSVYPFFPLSTNSYSTQTRSPDSSSEDEERAVARGLLDLSQFSYQPVSKRLILLGHNFLIWNYVIILFLPVFMLSQHQLLYVEDETCALILFDPHQVTFLSF